MKPLGVTVSTLFLAATFWVSNGWGAQPITFKLSVETVENHHRNMGLKIFRCLLEKNSQGRLKVDYYHSGQIYKGKDIPKALKIGTIEMAVPGIWQLEGIDPNTAITALPMFFGLPERVTKRLIDGEVGRLLNESLEKKLDVKVPGKWYYHGYVNICVKPRAIKTLEDWKGLKIRHPGGAANALRLKALGASPIMIPWPDLPMAMVQGTADGFITTYKSFDSAKLWETGTLHSTNDKEYYMNYIPLINGKFWRKLPPDLQKILVDTWAEHIDMQRAISDFEQRKGEDAMKEHGVQIYYPPDEELAKWRARVMTVQDQIVKEIGMDTGFVAKIKEKVEEQLKKK
jgi:TRAP-type C4-dicarboxylate transport system substrate-binding protein